MERKNIKLSKPVYDEVIRLKARLEMASANDVITHLLMRYHKDGN
jgi:predicted CopG family antitoxin